jgi:hypothetical protein
MIRSILEREKGEERGGRGERRGRERRGREIGERGGRGERRGRERKEETHEI